MNNGLLLLKISQRLNKLSSFDYDNIECWQIAEAFNKAQLEWVRRQIHGGNQYREGSEGSTRRIDDLQALLTTLDLKFTDRIQYISTETLPDNYLEFKRIAVKAKNDCCPERVFKCFLAEVSEVDGLLSDSNKCPSFEWAETFSTLSGNKAKIYTDGKFDVTKVELNYYRKPRYVVFNNCINPHTGTVATADVECEFKDDVAELLVDEAVSILAGDIESMTQFQRASQTVEKNN